MAVSSAVPPRRRTRLLLAAVLAAALVTTSAPASAATTSRWADWTFDGGAGAFTGTVALADTPALDATFTSDSRGGQVGVISGASTWLAEGTPVGAKYGSSRDRPYVNLRPRADTATGASVTTYTFSSPTPASGWTFVLGDIDADQVAIRAIGPDGTELPASALGFQGGFNYCAPGVAGKPSCTGSATDVPAWDAATRTLTGNVAATDTSGASAWFEPTQSIASLSFTFTRRAGFPVYQTWFATLARDITGAVTQQADGAPLAGVAVRLLDASGALVLETTTDASGAYAFAGVTATSGYTVEIVPPPGTVSVVSPRQPTDLTSADAAASFQVRDIVPAPVSGTVRDTAGAPIAGATVTLSDGTATLTAETSSDGTYLIDDVPAGTWTGTVTPPEGYSVSQPPLVIEVPLAETPVTGQDFEVVPNPTLSGTVTAEGVGVPGTTVTAVADGETFRAITDSTGAYRLPRIPAGAYTVTITPPPGYNSPTPTQSVTIAAADATLDFALEAEARTGVVTGSVSAEDGTPVSGATVTIDGPGGTAVATTDEAGSYSLDGLGAGEYTTTVTPPEGFQPVEPQTFTITEAGETVEASFVLVAIAAPAPSPTPTPTATPPAGALPAGELPATGGPDASPALWLGAGMLGVGLVAVGVGRAARRRR